MSDFTSSKWTPHHICGCAPVLWLVSGVKLDEVELETTTTKSRGLLSVFNSVFGPAVDDRPHNYCVEVEFTCARCDQEFTRTYDFEQDAKMARFGYYAENVGYERESSLKPLIGFLDVEDFYEKFEPTDYSYFAAMAFYEKIMKLVEEVAGEEIQ